MSKIENTVNVKVKETFADEKDGLKTKYAGKKYNFTVERYEELLAKGKVEEIKETKKENID